MNKEENNEVREGIGCILFIFAVFLAFVLISIADEVVDFLEAFLRSHT